MKAAAVVLSMCAICAWLSAAAAGPDKPGSAATRTVDVTMPGGTATFPPRRRGGPRELAMCAMPFRRDGDATTHPFFRRVEGRSEQDAHRLRRATVG